MSSTISPLPEGGLVLAVFFTHSFYLIGLVPSMPFSFSITFSSLIKVNSGKDFGSTLDTDVKATLT